MLRPILDDLVYPGLDGLLELLRVLHEFVDFRMISSSDSTRESDNGKRFFMYYLRYKDAPAKKRPPWNLASTPSRRQA